MLSKNLMLPREERETGVTQVVCWTEYCDPRRQLDPHRMSCLDVLEYRHHWYWHNCVCVCVCGGFCLERPPTDSAWSAFITSLWSERHFVKSLVAFYFVFGSDFGAGRREVFWLVCQNYAKGATLFFLFVFFVWCAIYTQSKGRMLFTPCCALIKTSPITTACLWRPHRVNLLYVISELSCYVSEDTVSTQRDEFWTAEWKLQSCDGSSSHKGHLISRWFSHTPKATSVGVRFGKLESWTFKGNATLLRSLQLLRGRRSEADKVVLQ